MTAGMQGGGWAGKGTRLGQGRASLSFVKSSQDVIEELDGRIQEEDRV